MSSKPLPISSRPIGAKDDAARRSLDVIGAATGLLLLSPLLAGLGCLIRLASPGPVFHRANRVGRHGEMFSIYKFRTMVVNAGQLGPGITTAGDRRITSVGRWLRRYKLDELPQLLNILKGDMSFVGPRPEDPRYAAFFTPEQREVLAVRPGLTSPASLQYRSEEQLLIGPDWEKTYLTVVLPDKLRLELDYLRQRTLWSDLWLILKTGLSLFR